MNVEPELSAEGVNEMEATLRIENAPGPILAFEVGYDGSIPPSPVGVGGDDGRLVIGTPMCWSEETPYRYAISFGGGAAALQFGILKQGSLTRVSQVASGPMLASAPDPAIRSIFVIGDSTAASNWINQLGWGTAFEQCFDPSRLQVLNRARAGRSTRSFIREGLWRRAESEMKRGDLVIVQFAHNDADTLDQGRCRGVLPGIGEEMREVRTPRGVEIVHTFGHYLRWMIGSIRARGASPILLSPTVKNQWTAGRLDRVQGEWGAWSREVAGAEGVTFIDASAIIADEYDRLGRERVSAFFCKPSDDVHTSPDGARLNARLIAAALPII